jgi:hypothetical protein
MLDPDEKVRAAACKVYSQLDYETALHHVSEAQLRAVAGRGADKKVGVSNHAHWQCVICLVALGAFRGFEQPRQAL